ncbi:MAG: dihydrolipoyl dehydrogenase [Gammaproteobacteria bacterium]
MSRVDVVVPDLGGFDEVPIIDVLVKAGDVVEVDTPLVTLETDKASMDVPSTGAGKVIEVAVKRGDKVSKGSVLVRLEADGAAAGAAPAANTGTEAARADTSKSTPAPEQDRAAKSSSPAGGSSARPAARPESGGDTVRMPAPDMSAKAKADAAKSAGAPATADAPKPATPSAPPAPAPAEAKAPAKAGAPGAPTQAQSATPLKVEGADRKAQLLVLGAGPGGYTAAFRAADLGMQVTLVERWSTLGGVCLNVGCIPSKALLHAAKVIDEASSMAAHGVSFGQPTIDYDKLRTWKMSIVKKLTGGLKMLAKQRKVDVITGTGKFVGPNLLEVKGADGKAERIAFDQCIIAAGSEPVKLPGWPDDPRIMDSTGALELPPDVKRLLVVGGGIIGLEMATVYESLGVKVSVCEFMPGLMPGADPDLVKPLEKRLRARYEAILLGTKATKVEALKEGIRVTFEGPKVPEPQVYDRVLVAVGRSPNGKVIGAEAAGVTVTDRGFIPADKQLRTNVPHIFAVGDIIGQPMLAHKAMHEAKVAAEVAAGEKRSFDVRAIPSVAYTDPEVAWAGLTETEAQAKNIPYKKGAFPWVASGRSLSLGRDEGFTKVLFDPESHRVLGAGIVGPNAGELIAELVLAIEMGADATDIGLTIHPHPTLSETVGLAAEAFEGTLTDLYIPKR